MSCTLPSLTACTSPTPGPTFPIWSTCAATISGMMRRAKKCVAAAAASLTKTCTKTILLLTTCAAAWIVCVTEKDSKMCGIAGFVTQEEHRDARAMQEIVSRMCGVIAHRGPDDQGVLVSGPAAIGMRRLSIIDLAGGHQPMTGCDRRIAIVFNGEIYNFRELQHELEARSHVFKTNSDTEAILHAFEEYGADCVNHLRGMFALAIWNGNQRELLIARDRAGKKPLYYTLTSRGTLIFGSELKTLREHPEFDAEIDPVALDAYLTFGYVPDPLTIFRGVHKLSPGHLATLKDSQLTVRRYWDFPYEQPLTNPVTDEAEAVTELQALLDESVRVRLMADVPLGAFLSGGVDSST